MNWGISKNHWKYPWPNPTNIMLCIIGVEFHLLLCCEKFQMTVVCAASCPPLHLLNMLIVFSRLKIRPCLTSSGFQISLWSFSDTREGTYECLKCPSLMSILHSESCVENVQVTIWSLLCLKCYRKGDAIGAKNKPNPAAERWSPKMTKPFDDMNSIASNLLLHMTSSMRFEGPLNGKSDIFSSWRML
jgi:hypothetical protein